jgi:hypothetical protein
MTRSNKVSWSLVAVLSLALTKAYFIDKNASQPVAIPPPVNKDIVSESLLEEYPGTSASSAYKGTIQVNKLPFPFNVDGTMPYQVWVDGKRVPLKSEQADQIVDALDLAKGKEFVQPDNTAEIHAGAGWIFPLPAPSPSVQ